MKVNSSNLPPDADFEATLDCPGHEPIIIFAKRGEIQILGMGPHDEERATMNHIFNNCPRSILNRRMAGEDNDLGRVLRVTCFVAGLLRLPVNW